ncbi:hypothetical protein M9Y10_024060 [Tritrichomonas musculus]|uniref:Uncharacterized protein n=1 Tax=Tritrichomonas musculus TaxID=1915356 RepID=A0ABR2KWX6_9EUKA
MTLSSSFSLTFVQIRSVSFSILNSISNSFYITFDNIKKSFIILTTQSEYFYNFPYVIYFYSPKYVSTNAFINIQQQKGLTGEKLIGIVCGSTSIFLLYYF